MIPPPPRSTLFPYTTLFRSTRAEMLRSVSAAFDSRDGRRRAMRMRLIQGIPPRRDPEPAGPRSEEHTSELQSRPHLVCRLLLEKKKKKISLMLTHTISKPLR